MIYKRIYIPKSYTVEGYTELMNVLVKMQIISEEARTVILTKIIPTLMELYEDRWDIAVVPICGSSRRKTGIYNIEIIIHYPELTVSNSRGRKEVIYDMYVKIVLQNTQFSMFNVELPDYISGIRTTYSFGQYISGYSFSHLPSQSNKFSEVEWQSFCLGVSEIRNAMMMCNMNDVNTLKLFFYQLDAYLTWESLEGGPYFKMENIVNTDYTDIAILSQNSIDNITSTIMSQINRRCYDFDYEVKNGQISVLINWKFDQVLSSTSAYKALVINNNYQKLAVILQDGTIKSLYSAVNLINDVNCNVIFRNKPVTVKILKKDVEEVDLTNSRIIFNPSIRNRIKEIIDGTTKYNQAQDYLRRYFQSAVVDNKATVS